MSGYKSILATAALVAAVTSASCNKAAKPNDDAISTDIKAKMFSEPLLKAASVNVDSKNGIVTLTGQVPDDAARLAAERIASQTDGVKQVIDSTSMAPAGPSADVNPPPTQPSRSNPAKPRREQIRSDSGMKNDGGNSGNSNTASNVTPPAPSAPVTPAAVTSPAPPAPPPPPKPITVTIPASTIVSIRTIDMIDSTTSRTGQLFNASIDAPIVADERVVVPKGANAMLKLVNASSAGKFKGQSVLTVSLDSFTYQGKTYNVASSDVQEKGGSRGKRSAAVIGGGAVLGALIGGLAGGGKGAAIGAAAGGGGGAAVQGLTHGQQIKIPAETRLDFTLHDPVDVTYLPTKRARPSSSSSGSPSSDQAPNPSSDQPPHP